MFPSSQRSQAISGQAPTMGINDIDPIAAMDPTFCLQLVNWFPATGSLQSRAGYQKWVTGLGSAVGTLATYYGPDGTQRMFAFTDNGLFDVSTQQTPSGTFSVPISIPEVTVTNGRWRTTQFGNVAGTYLICVNDNDASVMFNGTDWVEFVASAAPTTPGEVNGVDPSTWSNVLAFKNRLWFVQADSLTAWYLDIDAVGGVAKPFYIGGSTKRGGSLSYMASFSQDTGTGMDDMLVFHTTGGEVLIYQGDDPDVALDFTLSAVYFVGSPIGEISHTDLGGDVVTLTRAGISPLTSYMKGSATEAVSESMMSRRISKTLNRLANGGQYSKHWQALNLPSLQAIAIVIPPTGSLPAKQYVMNYLTGAWTEYNLPANCGVNFNGNFFFGGTDGSVYSFGNVYLDNVNLDGSGGTPIQCYMFGAFSYLGDPTSLKHFKLVRPVFQAQSAPSYLLHINTDYSISPVPGAAPNPPPSAGQSLWDSGIWNAAFWASAGTSYRPWTGVTGLGYCAALQLKVTCSSPVSFVAMEIIYETGGLI